MAFQEKIDQLVTRLTELTESGKVSWEETADEDTFLASVGSFVVTLGKKEDGGTYHFRILDGAGKTIEEAWGTLGENFSRLRRLHELARRHALRVDERLGDLLSSLEHI